MYLGVTQVTYSWRHYLFCYLFIHFFLVKSFCYLNSKLAHYVPESKPDIIGY